MENNDIVDFLDFEISTGYSQLRRTSLTDLEKERIRGGIAAYERVKQQLALKNLTK